jgi:hypothetical protein
VANLMLLRASQNLKVVAIGILKVDAAIVARPTVDPLLRLLRLKSGGPASWFPDHSSSVVTRIPEVRGGQEERSWDKALTAIGL